MANGNSFKITSKTALILIAALVVVALIIVLVLAGSNRAHFNLDVLRGLVNFSGDAERNSVQADSMQEEQLDDADQMMKWLRNNLNIADGRFIVTDTTLENSKVAANLYTKLQGDVIATDFFESPDYGVSDFAKNISPGVKFYRITTNDVCNTKTEKLVRERFQTFASKPQLVVIPKGHAISKIGGIFARLPDKSHLAFIALNNVADKHNNTGLIFSGPIAEKLYNYYKSFIK